MSGFEGKSKGTRIPSDDRGSARIERETDLVSDPGESADVRVRRVPSPARPSPRQLLRLACAAVMRAEGHGWEAIGPKLGCRPETCRAWPERYAAIWDNLLAEARREVLAAQRTELAAAQAEALFVLRRQRR